MLSIGEVIGVILICVKLSFKLHHYQPIGLRFERICSQSFAKRSMVDLTSAKIMNVCPLFERASEFAHPAPVADAFISFLANPQKVVALKQR